MSVAGVVKNLESNNMKPTKLTVRVGRTYNIGNYESLRVDVECEFESSTPTVDRDREWLADRVARAGAALHRELDLEACRRIKQIRG